MALPLVAQRVVVCLLDRADAAKAACTIFMGHKKLRQWTKGSQMWSRHVEVAYN